MTVHNMLILRHMKARTTVVLDRDLMEHLRARARQRGTTVTSEVQAAISQYLAEENSNPGLLALVGVGCRQQDWPAVDSDAAREQYGADLERDAFNPEAKSS